MAQTRTAQTIVDQALRSIGAIATGETPSSNERSDGLAALQDLIASWGAEGIVIPYLNERQELTLTADTSAYTIGSGGDFNTTRPIQIVGATGKGGSNLEHTYRIIDATRYRKTGLKSTGGDPYWLWYNPVFPLGEIKIYPTPSSAYTLYLDSLDPITEPSALATNVQLPEGYNRALRFNLAIDLSAEYEVPDSILTRVMHLASQSKSVIVSRNAASRVEVVYPEIDRIAGEMFNIDAC